MPERALTEAAGRERAARCLVIWRFSDGKAGHDNQSLGLAEAIADETECEIHSLTPIGASAALMCLATGRAAPFRSFPDPDLILGAGHATHLSMLAARRSRGGRSVVLMTPTLPKFLFDLCLIPEHDRSINQANVVTTRGALNRVRRNSDKEVSSGLILLGGPSAHFDFNDKMLVEQIEAVIKADESFHWTAVTSRRTPSDLTAAMRAINARSFNLVPVEETVPGWLSRKLGKAARVWVTEDSASMVYEALSSGAAVGLLPLRRQDSSRVSRGVDELANQGLLTRFDAWLQGAALRAPEVPLDEAARCARLILERWPALLARK